MISGEQKKKVSKAVKKQLLQMSDMQWELQKKQQGAVARQRHAGIKEKCTLYVEPQKSQAKSKRKRGMKADSVHPSGKGYFYKNRAKKRKTGDNEIDRLLILADSAELLLKSEDNFHHLQSNDQCDEGIQIHPISCQSQNQLSNANATDQKLIETQLDATEVEANVKNGKKTLLLQGKIRLSQIRGLARSKNRPLAPQTSRNYIRGHLRFETLEDNQGEWGAARRSHKAIGFQDASAASYNLKELEGIREHQLHKEDSRCDAVQSSCEQVAHGRKQPRVAEPLVLNGARRNATTEHHSILRQSMQMNGVGDLSEEQRLARQLRLLKTNKLRGHLRKQHSSASHQDQMHALAKKTIGQVHALAEKQTGQICVIEPEWQLQNSRISKDQHFNAPQRQKVRSFEKRKQLKENHFSAAQIQGNQQTVKENKLDAQNGEPCEVSQQWQLQMSDLQQKEHHRLPARPRRAKRIKKQRAPQNVRKYLNSRQVSVENHFSGGTLDPHVIRREERDKPFLGMDQDFQQPVEVQNNVSQMNGNSRLSQLKREARLKVEVQKNVSRANGKNRLSQLKREARLKGKVQKNVSQVNGRSRLSQLKHEARLRNTV